jgi:hypothetical protein
MLKSPPTTWRQPIGLLVNELLTNAAKHGAGLIEVTYSKNNHEHLITDAMRVTAYRSTLICLLNQRAWDARYHPVTQQLQGRVEASNRQDGTGSCFEAAFLRPTFRSTCLRQLEVRRSRNPRCPVRIACP